MKYSTRFVRLFLVATAALTLATVARTGAAAGGAGCADGAQVDPTAAHNAAVRREQTGAATSPLTLVVKSASGSTSRLTYVENDGWRFDDSDANLKPGEVRVVGGAGEVSRVAALKEDRGLP